MSDYTAKATTELYLNGTAAKNEIAALEQKAQQLSLALDNAREAGNKALEKTLNKQLKECNTNMKQLQRETLDVTKVLNNLSSAKPKELEATIKRLNNALNSDDVKRGDKDWIKLTNSIKAARAELEKVNAEQGKGQSSWAKAADGFNRYFGGITAGIAALAGLTLGLKKFMDMRNELEQSQASLESITGLSKADIADLTEEAKKLSTTTTETGVRITASSKEIVDGFTTIGSKRPELLGNKEALKEVTEQALILAAAGVEPAVSFDAVTASLNQFNLGADQSARVINVLAAGSLAGSAEANDLAGSMKNVGTVASDSNMSLEQTVAMLEVLASKQIVGEEAGTKLRGSLLKLKDAGVGYASGQFNVRDALIEVNAQLAKHTSAAEQDAIKQKIFGAENITAGTILLQNVDAYDSLTNAVTGTNEAQRQAQTNTQTTAAKLKQAQNQFNELGMELVKNLNPAILKATDFGTGFLKLLVQMPKFLNENKATLIALGLAIAGYTTVTYAQIAADKIKFFWNEKLKESFKKLWLTLSENPWGAIAMAAGIFLGVLIDIWRKNKDIAESQQTLRDINKKISDEYIDQKSKIDSLVATLENEKISLDKRKQALGELQKIIPGYHAQLTAEGKLINNNKNAIDDYLKSLEKEIAFQVRQESLKEAMNKQLKAQRDVDLSNKESESLAKQRKSGELSLFSFVDKWNEQKEIRHKAFQEMEDAKEVIKQLEKEISTAGVPSTASTQTTSTKNPTGGTPETDTKELDKQLKAQEKLLEDANNEIINKYKARRNEELDWQEEYDALSEAQELAHLKALESLRKKYGKSTTDLQGQILDKEQSLRTKTDKLEAKKNKEKLNKASDGMQSLIKLENEKADKQAESIDKQHAKFMQAEAKKNEMMKADFERQASINQLYSDAIGNFGGMLGQFLADQEMSTKDFMKGMIMLALDVLEKQVLINVAAAQAGSLASPESIATWGAAGTAKAAIITGLIMAAFEGVKAVVSAGLENGGSLVDVTRAQDGKLFKAENNPNARGFVSRTSLLVSENGEEYVTPAGMTRQPVVRSVLNVFETARRNNRISSITPEVIAASVGIQARGYKSGGFLYPQKESSKSNNNITDMTPVKLLVDEIRGNKIKNIIYVEGKGSISEQMQKMNKNQANSRRLRQ